MLNLIYHLLRPQFYLTLHFSFFQFPILIIHLYCPCLILLGYFLFYFHYTPSISLTHYYRSTFKVCKPCFSFTCVRIVHHCFNFIHDFFYICFITSTSKRGKILIQLFYFLNRFLFPFIYVREVW